MGVEGCLSGGEGLHPGWEGGGFLSVGQWVSAQEGQNVDRMTDASENIAFPQLRWRAVITVSVL